MPDSTEERRKCPRVSFSVPVRCRIRGFTKCNSSLSDDISYEGIGFFNDEFIAPETLLMLEFTVLARSLTPMGEVVWANPLRHSDRYRLGVKFLEIQAEESTFLSDYIGMRIENLY